MNSEKCIHTATVCEKDCCTGCMACVDICPKNAISIKDQLYAYNAVINQDICIECNACHNVCPTNYQGKTILPQEWYQGWALNEQVRELGASGGVATEITRAFIQDGGIVCSCEFRDGKFGFGFAENDLESKKFAGSKYVKSNPAGIYKKIRELLKNERKVLFIGLPCQVAALKNFVGEQLAERLYTVDLICHGTPSPDLLELFLKQYKRSLKKLEEISFRKKFMFQLSEGKKSIVAPRVCDRYSIAFLQSLLYTENCYRCNYAKKERVSDLTIGDSWGSELPAQEIEKGISLALCQTEKGNELLKNAELHLEAVDLEKAISRNQQLMHPSIMPDGRKKFFEGILKGKRFNNLVLACYPKLCIRQSIKEILIKMKIIH